MNTHLNAEANIKPTKTSTLTEWLVYMQKIHVSAIDMGLSRVLPVAEQLGLLKTAKDDAYVFTVAGTNGKGSTTAVISEICQQAGYKTALYQSPELIDFNERVRINGMPVDDGVLIDAFVQVEQARVDCELTLSFFEMTTLAAMLIFAQAKCDVWVLEVGLGGRLDVVNIIDPDLAIITNIGIDHVDWLGDTREKIGFEKAGILREGIPLIYGEEDMPESVKKQATSLHCPVFQIGQDYDYLIIGNTTKDMVETTATKKYGKHNNGDYYDSGHDSELWQFSSASVTLQLPKPKLSLLNSANAVAALLTSQLNINIADIEKGLQKVKLAGRFDYRELRGRHWLFDVAHNERGMSFLLSQFVPLWQHHKQSYPNAKLHIVFSMLADKDINAVVKLLADSQLPFAKWYIAKINHSRAAAVLQLETILRHNEISRIIESSTLVDAAQSVIEDTSKEDLILVCGSFHTIGEVVSAIH